VFLVVVVAFLKNKIHMFSVYLWALLHENVFLHQLLFQLADCTFVTEKKTSVTLEKGTDIF